MAASAVVPGSTSPFSPFEWMLAGRYLRPRRKSGFVSVIALFSFLGIMLGVGTLIVVMSVMNGFRAELYDKILGINGHMLINKVGEPFRDFDAVRDRVVKVPGVVTAMPLIEGQVMLSTRDGLTGGFVRGMRAADIKNMKLVFSGLRFGNLDKFDGTASVALGMRLANKLNASVGDMVTLVNPKGKSTVFGVKPNIKAYKVAAIFEIGMSEYDETIAFIPLDEAQRYFNQPGEVTVLEVMTQDPEAIDKMAAEVQRAGGPTVQISDWRDRNSSFFTVLEVERNMMFIVLSMIVLVAAFNIISGLMMLVKDKGRDIGILRTMGASQGSIMRVFLITGASIGIVGTIAGLVLGVVMALNIDAVRRFVSMLTHTTLFDPNVYFLQHMPALIDPWETAAIVLMALALSVLATLYPSWRASRLDPVQALRYE